MEFTEEEQYISADDTTGMKHTKSNNYNNNKGNLVVSTGDRLVKFSAEFYKC